jgi:hypothetical protein
VKRRAVYHRIRMRRAYVLLPVIIFLGLAVCLAGCASDLRVTTIQLGRSLNADGTVANHTTTFTPDETVYVSVITAGAGSGTVGVRWTYAGRVMGEPKKEVRGAAATEFHLQSAGGFPPGEYKVEAFLNGQPAESRTFRVTNP